MGKKKKKVGSSSETSQTSLKMGNSQDGSTRSERKAIAQGQLD